MEQGPRFVSEEETRRIRESVEKGVKRVAKPFLERVEAQSRIVSGTRIGGPDDLFCHPRPDSRTHVGRPDDVYYHPK